jgi:hypothetical protein
LLAAIPAARLNWRRRWGVRAGVVGALAAAGLLAVLAWQARDGANTVPSVPTSQVNELSAGFPTQPAPRSLDDSDGIAARREARRVLDEADPPTFTWPLPETSPVRFSTSIPPDLLD